jgi:8-oxo-dGTP pyrophosphatase MutT (NUDIX family)
MEKFSKQHYKSLLNFNQSETMKKSKKVTAVLFRKRKGKREFLVMHRKLHWRGWEIVKGTLEKGESLEHALKREIFEETEYRKIKILKRLRESQNYFDELHGCLVQPVGFAVQTFEKKKVRLDKKTKEHSGYKWLAAKKALRMLTWPEQKKIFRAALKFLGEQND